MRTRIQWGIRMIRPASSLAIAIALSLSALPAAHAADARVSISNGDRAFIALQVQNVMSRHEFYHAAGMNLEEVDHLWVRADGEFAASATFASPAWVMPGIPVIRGAYGEENQKNRENALKALNAVDPKVKYEIANLGAGHEFSMHTSTTSVIEVAGDGKTAKGVWYSPGYALMTRVSDGKAQAGGMIFNEKYAGDFVLEDGRWKIWHLQMAYDFVPQMPSEMLAQLNGAGAGGPGGPGAGGPPPGGGGAGGPPPGGGAGGPPPSGGKAPEAAREAGERMGPQLPPAFKKPAYSYPSFTPQRPGLIYPRLPEPYYTFSETFSYCNCDATSFPVTSATVGIVKALKPLRPDVSPFVSEVDANHDGKMTRAEWQAKAMPESSFNMFEKGRGYVTQFDYENNSPPDGIDLNGDGKLTVGEFVAFDKQMSAKMPPDGTPPPRN